MTDDKAVGWRTGLALASALLGIAVLPMAGAEAQYVPVPWSYPYYDGYPPPMPPGRVARGEMAPPTIRPDEASAILPLAEIRRRVAALGFHLIATPRRKDHIYLAEADDVHGLTHRLVFDAYRGNIIENTKLAALPKRPKLADDAQQKSVESANKPVLRSAQ
jgi:hypothetical protein